MRLKVGSLLHGLVLHNEMFWECANAPCVILAVLKLLVQHLILKAMCMYR